jgi:hypothetical protein
MRNLLTHGDIPVVRPNTKYKVLYIEHRPRRRNLREPASEQADRKFNPMALGKNQLREDGQALDSQADPSIGCRSSVDPGGRSIRLGEVDHSGRSVGQRPELDTPSTLRRLCAVRLYITNVRNWMRLLQCLIGKSTSSTFTIFWRMESGRQSMSATLDGAQDFRPCCASWCWQAVLAAPNLQWAGTHA